MSRLLAFARRRPLLSYFAIAFALSWTGVGIIAARTGFPAADVGRGALLAAFGAMLLGPSVAGLAMTAVVGGREGLRAYSRRLLLWRVPLRWYGALLVAPVLVLLALLSRGETPGVIGAPSAALVIVTALVVGFGAGIFEELGWTGFATPRMLRRRSVVRAGLELGVIWMSWHVLADAWGGAGYGELYFLHLLLWFVALISYRLLMTWVFDHTGSTLLGILMHASFTGSQALLGPVDPSPLDAVAWYGLFAGGMAAVAAFVAFGARETAPSPASA